MPLMSEVKQTGKRSERIGTFLSWMLAVLACLWVAWCCAIGPLYWFGDGLSDFGWLNVLYLVVAFAIWFSIVVALVRFGRGRRVLPQYFARRHEKLCNEIAGTPTTVLGIMLRHLHDAAHSRPGRALIFCPQHRAADKAGVSVGRGCPIQPPQVVLGAAQPHGGCTAQLCQPIGTVRAGRPAAQHPVTKRAAARVKHPAQLPQCAAQAAVIKHQSFLTAMMTRTFFPAAQPKLSYQPVSW